MLLYPLANIFQIYIDIYFAFARERYYARKTTILLNNYDEIPRVSFTCLSMEIQA